MTFEDYCLAECSARFTQPISPAQRIFMDSVALVVEGGGQVEVPSLPRGCGTTTILQAAACFAVKVHKEPFVVLVGSNRMWNIMPSMAERLGLGGSSYRRCGRTCWVQLNHGDRYSSVLLVCSQKDSLRGLSHKINGSYERPSLVIVDGHTPLSARERKHFKLLASKAFISDPLNV